MSLVQIQNAERAIRVFPQRNKWTPNDPMAFVGEPPLFREFPENTPVMVSVTFTWHKVIAYGEVTGHSHRLAVLDAAELYDVGEGKMLLRVGENGVSIQHEEHAPVTLPGWLHLYTHPLLAVLLNPIHACLAPKTMRLFEATAGGRFKHDHGLKFGATEVTLLREIPVPEVTTNQKIRFGILCVKQVCTEEKWNRWADAWLDGSDRSKESAEAAEAASASAAAAWSADAVRAAAAWSASASRAAAAWSASAAARAAAEAAAKKSLDLIALAQQAVAVKE